MPVEAIPNPLRYDGDESRIRTGKPCKSCGGPVYRHVTVDGYLKGAGHHNCTECREKIAAEREAERAAWRAKCVHPVKHCYIEAVRVPITCGCGCGEAINADTIEILKLRNEGMTFRKIAAELGRNEYAVRQRIRSMPQYVKGHIPLDGRQWAMLPCFRCGAPVKCPRNAAFPKCSGRNSCGHAAIWRNVTGAPTINPWDEKERRLRERHRANTAAADVLMAPHRERRKQERRERYASLIEERRERLRLRRAGWTVKRIEREQAKLKRAEERELVRAEKRRDEELIALAKAKAVRPGSEAHWAQLGVLDGELAALLEEQKRDARANQIQYEQSMDLRFDGNDDGSWAAARSGGVSFDRDEDKWAYYAGQGRTRHRKLSA